MRKLNILLKINKDLQVGDWILFQEYTPLGNSTGIAQISKPIYAIYLGMTVVDQAIAMRYIKVPRSYYGFGDKHPREEYYISSQEHIEWYDYIDVLKIWKKKPSFRNLLKAYRKRNQLTEMYAKDFKIR